MPYRSGSIQIILGAVAAVAFVISNSFGSPGEKQKRLVGTIHKRSTSEIALTEQNAREHSLRVADDATIFLNDRKITLAEIQDGRTATVLYEKKDGQLLAKRLEIFPTHDDFPPAVPISGPAAQEEPSK
jgi:hypothetical protein